jgi:hypothetical protein
MSLQVVIPHWQRKCVYVDDETHEFLKEFAEANNITISHAVYIIIGSFFVRRGGDLGPMTQPQQNR